jgi:hypothetical protein
MHSSSSTIPVFTFIMGYRGGTYVSQVTVASIEAAIIPWAQDLSVDEIGYFGPRMKARLLSELQQNTYGLFGATRLRDVANAWYVTVPMPGGAGTSVNAVQTDVGGAPVLTAKIQHTHGASTR